MVTIRLATPGDAESLAALAEQTFRQSFSAQNSAADTDLHCSRHFAPEIQAREIRDTDAAMIVGESDGELLAYAFVRLVARKKGIHAERPAELNRLYVLEQWHGCGVAHEVMGEVLAIAAIRGADCIWLGVWEENPRAIAFYQRHGFTVIGDHVFHVGNDPQRDLVMARQIGSRVRIS